MQNAPEDSLVPHPSVHWSHLSSPPGSGPWAYLTDPGSGQQPWGGGEGGLTAGIRPPPDARSRPSPQSLITPCRFFGPSPSGPRSSRCTGPSTAWPRGWTRWSPPRKPARDPPLPSPEGKHPLWAGTEGGVCRAVTRHKRGAWARDEGGGYLTPGPSRRPRARPPPSQQSSSSPTPHIDLQELTKAQLIHPRAFFWLRGAGPPREG